MTSCFRRRVIRTAQAARHCQPQQHVRGFLTSMAQEIVLPRPDDLHLHLRDGSSLQLIMQGWPGVFSRALIMPNLKPPVTDTAGALAYRDRIMKATPAHTTFQPLMTLYLTNNTTPEEITLAAASGAVFAVKLYPAGATTNSDGGVTDLRRVYPALEAMAACGLPLCVHGEVTDARVDVFEREPRFVEGVLKPLLADFPTLRVVMEHITTKEAVQFVQSSGSNVAATITPQHLLYSRNALFEGGLRPHRYCLPILKHETDRQALLDAIRSGSPKFFLGTDSAPHARASKECACGAAGMYSAHAALELYALAFEEAGCLHHLRAFACEHGADFYRLPRSDPTAGSVILRRETWRVPETYAFGDGSDGSSGVVVPMMAGQDLPWKAHVVQ